MKLPGILVAALTAALFATGAATVQAAAFVWDGGSPISDDWTEAANWNPNVAPDNDGTADLIFGGSAGLNPNINVLFDVGSISFNNTAGAFSIGGRELTVRARGISNEDTQIQTLTNAVRLGENSTFAAAAGPLTLTTPVIIGDRTLTVSGGFATSFAGFTGTGRVIKNGAGTLSLNPSAVQQADLIVNSGAVNLAGATTFGSSSVVAIAGATFNANQNLTLEGGGLTRDASGVFVLGAGRTLTIKSGADAVFTGNFTLDTAATINVGDPGSTLQATNQLEFRGGSTINITSGGVVGGTAPVDLGGDSLDITVLVDGPGSALNAGGTSRWGSEFETVTVTFRNGAAGTLGTLELALADFVEPTANLRIESDADVTMDSLFAASEGVLFASPEATVTVTGAGSTLTQTGASLVTLGTTSDSGRLQVADGGSFTSGTGLTTVNGSGSITIAGGTYHANGNVTLNGGRLDRDSTGVFNLATGKTLTVQNGGDAVFANNYTTSGAVYNVTGAGSTLSTTALPSVLSISAGAMLNVTAGGAVVASDGLRIGDNSSGTARFDGAGSSLSASAVFVGVLGGNGSLTFSNGATGSFNLFRIGSVTGGALLPTGTVSIESGASVTAAAVMDLGSVIGGSGTLTITGANSSLIYNGANELVIGATGGGSGTLTVADQGAFERNNGPTTVNATGVIQIDGGFYNSNGDLTINGGTLTRAAGAVFNLASGRALNVQNGGEATFAGSFSQSFATTINVSGAGSTLTTSSSLLIEGSSQLNVSAGGTVSIGSNLTVGDDGSNGTVVVDGIGSSLSANSGSFGDDGGTGTLTFRNGASGSFANTVLMAFSGNPPPVANLNVESGADVSFGPLGVAIGGGGGTATITVTGAGSTFTQSGDNASLILGNNNNNGTGTLNVLNGGAVMTPVTTRLDTSGRLIINGGSATFNGPLDNDGFISVVNGSLTVNGEFRFDPGAILSAGAGGTVTFNGAVDAGSNFSGDAGLINFAGSLRTVPDSLTVGTSAIFTATNTLTLEIGGLAAGVQHDELIFTGFGFPHVTFGGVLVIDLIFGFNPQLGQQFDIFDFDPARVAGTFSSIQLAPGDALAPGLFFSDSQLYSTGILTIVPEPGSALLLTFGAAMLSMRKRTGRDGPGSEIGPSGVRVQILTGGRIRFENIRSAWLGAFESSTPARFTT